jgi:hypothetical protein
MTTMRGFAHRMRGIADGVPRNADRLVRQIALAVTIVVVKKTPVDTGRAKGNWQAQLATPAAGVLPAPSTPGAGEQAAIQRAQAVAAAYKGGVDVNITNNLVYIVPLNEGHSDQAPIGFVEAACAEAVRKVQSTRIIR